MNSQPSHIVKAVRIAGFHPADPGSSPGVGTSFVLLAVTLSFLLAFLTSRRRDRHLLYVTTYALFTSLDKYT